MTHDEPKVPAEAAVDPQHVADDCLCPDAETLFFYGEGLLEPGESRIVAAHIAGCARCREQHELEMELTVNLRRLPLPEPSPSMLGAVRQRIAGEQRRRVSPWWWIAAAFFIVASALRWVLVADLSLQGAVVAALDLVVFVLRSPLVLVAWVTDADTWADAAVVAQSVFGTLTSSPLGIALLTMVALAAVAATNLALFGAARRVMRG